MIDRLYITAGLLWLMTGMVFGIWVGVSESFMFSNSHAHANLLGFVVSALFGLICHAWPRIAEQRFAIVQFWVYQLGALTLVAGKFDIDGGGTGTLAPPGATLVVLATVWFAILFWRATARSQPSLQPAARGPA